MERRTHHSTYELLQQDRYSPEEAAAVLHIDLAVVRHAAFTGELPARIVGHDIIDLRREDLLTWLEAREGLGPYKGRKDAIQMGDEPNLLATALGTYSPRQYLVAVFDDPAKAANALTALRDSGFSDSAVAICPGAQFLANWSEFARQRGPIERLADLFPAEEHAALGEYVDEAARGASFVTVHITAQPDITRARDLLEPLGGHAMRYYGNLAITDLS